MPNPFLTKLEHGSDLNIADRSMIDHICAHSRPVLSRNDIISEGMIPSCIHIITEGIACRYKILPDGSRQISSLLLPGDFDDLHADMLNEIDHALGTNWGCQIVELSFSMMEKLNAEFPNIVQAMQWADLVDKCILHEWIANIGQRSADKRMAHLICELLVRLQTVGFANKNSFEFPLSQQDMADALGISVVHANRTLQDLQARNVLSWKKKKIRIPNVDVLKEFAGFDPDYLHLKHSLNTVIQIFAFLRAAF